MMAASRLVHFVHNPTQKSHVFHDTKSLDLYDDLRLFQHLPHLELLQLIDELSGDLQYLVVGNLTTKMDSHTVAPLCRNP